MLYKDLSTEEKEYLAEQGISPEKYPEEDELWEAVYEVMINHIVDNNDEPDDVALKLERIYDRAIYE